MPIGIPHNVPQFASTPTHSHPQQTNINFFPAMTKIVDTLGPKSRSVEVTSACLKARMPGFSKCMGNVYLCPYNLCMHALLLVRFLVRDRKEVECCLLYCCCLCQVMMDTFGAKMHVVNKSEKVADGQVVLTPNWGKEASSQILPINLDGLAMSMTKGDTIFIGHYLFTGSETTSDVICTIENLTTLAGSLFTLHASQIHVDLPTLSDKDNEASLKLWAIILFLQHVNE
ncbi:Pyruvate kinase 2, cytosolic [Glycine max]|nr:Pyruvate kinase 2, cytosolic [Glycine max]